MRVGHEGKIELGVRGTRRLIKPARELVVGCACPGELGRRFSAVRDKVSGLGVVFIPDGLFATMPRRPAIENECNLPVHFGACAKLIASGLPGSGAGASSTAQLRRQRRPASEHLGVPVTLYTCRGWTEVSDRRWHLDATPLPLFFGFTELSSKLGELEV